MTTMEYIGNITALVLVLAALFGVPTAVVELLRQRRRAKEHLAELQAWRAAQDRAQEEHTRTYVESVQVQKDGHAQAKDSYAAYLRFNERYIELHEARLKVAESHLDELRRANTLLGELIGAVRASSGR